jgi:hypothetical protein
LARVLSQQQPVTLLTPNASPLMHADFEVRAYADVEELRAAVAEHRTVVLQGFTLLRKPEISDLLVASENYIAVDVYTPLDLEGLELRQGVSEDAVDWNLVDVSVLRQQFKIGDFFFCASERQRDYWLGMLSALGRLNPHVYWNDQTGRSLIDVVPFGLSDSPPVYRGPVLKGVHPNIAASDKVLLWFGGLWNWLDPLTVIHAFARVVSAHPEARLVFVTRMPEDLESQAALKVVQAVALSRELGLYGDHVLFCEGIPYDERGSLLLEADVGLCYHPDHLEARFSFRTRLLDYIWAGLPVITGAGDVLGELVAAEGLGYAVPPDDVDGMVAAMRALLQEPDPRRARREAFARVRARFVWEEVAAPLVDFCRAPRHAADWRVEAYATYRSSDWENLIYENAENRHQVGVLRRRLQDVIEERDALIAEKDAVIDRLRNGRIMRVIISVQEFLQKVPWLGPRLRGSGEEIQVKEEA